MASALPSLPTRAAYLHLNNPTRRNALSLAVLRSLRSQLIAYNTSPTSGKLRLLPPFKASIIQELELAAERGPSNSSPPAVAKAKEDYSWLLSSKAWHAERHGLPNVLVLRSPGTVFCSGHDLSELSTLSHGEVKETFALCAEVMSLIRRSPAIVVGVIQNLATAAGAQLAMSLDFPIALDSAMFRLPGATMGLPCTSPAAAVVRRAGVPRTFRMLAMAEPVSAAELGGAVDVVKAADGCEDEEKWKLVERRVEQVVQQLAEKTAGQPQALGKWAFWTQIGLNGQQGGDGMEGRGGDGYEDAVHWTGRMMSLHARADDAREGMEAFLGKRPPDWKT